MTYCTIDNSFTKAGLIVSNENLTNMEDEDDISLMEITNIWIQQKAKKEINDTVQIDVFLLIDFIIGYFR